MTRLIEIALILTPLIGFAIWRFAAPSDHLAGRLVAWCAGAVAVLMVLLLVLRQRDARDGDSAYLPAHMENGRVIPGRAAPP
jgi:F0F1-type ATP synthase assembly protein I